VLLFFQFPPLYRTPLNRAGTVSNTRLVLRTVNIILVIYLYSSFTNRNLLFYFYCTVYSSLNLRTNLFHYFIIYWIDSLLPFSLTSGRLLSLNTLVSLYLFFSSELTCVIKQHRLNNEVFQAVL
jgi:hypothetical protein